MNSIFELSRPIEQLKKQEKFSNALELFKQNKVYFNNEQIAQNFYLVSDMLTCLRKLNHFEAGFQFLNIYGIEVNNKTNERIVTAYGWLLWSKYKSEHSQGSENEVESHYFEDEDDLGIESNVEYNKSELIEKIEFVIIILFEINNSFNQTLISNLFSIVLKSEKKKPAPNWTLVNEFCNAINPTLLSTDCYTIKVERKGQLKDMELASDFENWYAYKTKALTKIGEWQECLDLSKEALEKIKNFHYSNDAWFSRRVAIAKRNLGNTEDTIQELETILKKKREWFIQKELAELYLEKENIDLAFKMAINAINNFGPLEFKIDLLYLIGKILKQQDKLDLSFKHFTLSKLVRQSEDWKIPQKLFEELRGFSFTEIPLTDLKELKKELQKFWNSFNTTPIKTFDKTKTTTDKNLEGEIIEIRNDNERGKDGFLKSNGQKYYFSVSSNFHLSPNIMVGKKVLFEIIPATDNKKEHTRIKKTIA